MCLAAVTAQGPSPGKHGTDANNDVGAALFTVPYGLSVN